MMIRHLGGILMCAASLFLVARPTDAQNGVRIASAAEPTGQDSTLLRIPVTVNAKNAPLEAVLRDLARQVTGRILYDNTALPRRLRVTYQGSDVALLTALSQILRDTDIEVVLSQRGELVVLKKPGAADPALPPDTVSGVIQGPDSLPLADARVTVLTGDRKHTKIVYSDKQGRYVAVIDGGAPYYVIVGAPGMEISRAEAKQNDGKGAFQASVKMHWSMTRLQAMNVTGKQDTKRKPFRYYGDYDDYQVDGDAHVGVGGDLGQLFAAVSNTLFDVSQGINGTLAGMQVPGSPGSATLLINGVVMPAMRLPRGGVWGIGYGIGTSGANGNMSIGTINPGELRDPETTLDFSMLPPFAQFGGSAAHVPGGRYNTFEGTITRHGHFRRDSALRLVEDYALFVEGDRRAHGAQSLLDVADGTLGLLGVDRDSAARFMSYLQNAGIPLGRGGRSAVDEHVSLLFAMNPYNYGNRQQYYFALGASGGRQTGAMAGPLAPASSGAQPWDRRVFSTLSFTKPWHDFLSLSTTMGAWYTKDHTAPYLAIPSAQVRVMSTANGVPSGLAMLQFGSLASVSDRSAAGGEISESVRWNSRDTRHAFFLTGRTYFHHWSDLSAPNGFGTYTYNSLAELEAGTPATFTRLLGADVTRVDSVGGDLSFRDSWHRTKRLYMSYTLNLHDAHYGPGLPTNAAVDSIFGLATGRAPTSPIFNVHGWFQYRYGRNRNTGHELATIAGRVALAHVSPVGAMWQTLQRSSGLPSGIQQLNCVGSGIPQPDWNAFLGDSTAIPKQCADGSEGSPLGSATPTALAFARSFVPARLLWTSWRLTPGGADFSATFRSWLRLDYLRWTHQPSQVDANLVDAPLFLLPSEGNRPVFAPAGDIVPQTGAVSVNASRLHDGFGPVTAIRSDMTSNQRQLSAGFWWTQDRDRLTPNNIRWVMAEYRYRETREFSLSLPSGDPRVASWSSGAAPRHSISFLGQVFSVDHGGGALSASLIVLSSITSGQRYTPVVAGDVNADGNWLNDRAFVFSPGAGQDPMSSGMTSLLASAPANARACLSSQLGKIAARNSCTGPWSMTLSAYGTGNAFVNRLHRFVRFRVTADNVLSGLDEGVHGATHTHGWGSMAAPDPVLLTVKRFDASRTAFVYDVNPRFGSTVAARNWYRPPFQLTVSASFALGTDQYYRETDRYLRSRYVNGRLKTVDEFVGKSGMHYTHYYFQAFDSLADQLELTALQRAQLDSLNREQKRENDDIYRRYAERILALPKDASVAESWAAYRQQMVEAEPYRNKWNEIARNFLTPIQFGRLPRFYRLELGEKEIDDPFESQ